MLGRTISHYRILRELGSGGMGVVYAAEDVRLGRHVAIKFVPEGMADDRQLLERLRGEARTASSLNHPSICTLYDIGDHDGRPFIVMELLQGRTLRERLTAGPLKVDETLELGIQVADALDFAHREHIIHRDIKPANLFLSDRGPVKILDFGLAKVVAHQPSALTAAPTDLTSAGMTLGTVAYMSPEQVTGDPLDGRSDIFSFGVVLYECVTGHQPFKGKTSGLILSEILNRTPPAPLVFNPDLPLRLQEIITNCLEKDRGLRYQDSAALKTDLRRLKRDLESGPRTASIVVPVDTAADATVSGDRGPVATPSSRDDRTVLGAAAGAVILVAIAAAVFVFRAGGERHASEATTHTAVPTVASDPAATAPPPPSTPLPAAVREEPKISERRRELSQPPSIQTPVRQPIAPRAAPLEPPAAPAITAPPAAAATNALSVPTPVIPPVSPPPSPETAKSASAPPQLASVTAAAAAAPQVAASAEDDDAAIRHVIAAYAHAIESKDIDAFKSVKPNLSSAERRRLEDSFHAVASQKVEIAVSGIERRGTTAVVRVRRRDTLAAAGRSQTSDSQQTMTLIRSGAGWVISEIGR